MRGGLCRRPQLLRPRPARLRSPLRSPPARAAAPPARLPVRPPRPAGALTLGRSLGVLPRAAPRSALAAAGCAGSAGKAEVLVRGYRPLIINHWSPRLVPCAR